MYTEKRFYVYGLEKNKNLLDTFVPISENSSKWKNWVSALDEKTCPVCREEHGRIYKMHEEPPLRPPIHNKCRCKIIILQAILPGNATKDGNNGADYHLKYNNKLPECYISMSEARRLGYKPILGNLDKVAPGKQLTKGIYHNYDMRLPRKNGRIWYEADINYTSGYRNNMRIIYSNDGLMFVTYDHYQTYYEIL